MVTRGVVHRGRLHVSELYDRGAQLRQCFRCQRYGHIARRCKADHPACGQCGEEHESRDHKYGVHSDSPNCVNCRGDDHNVWSPTCSVRARELERMKKRLAVRPSQYGEYRREVQTTSVGGPVPKADGRTRGEKQLKRQRIDETAGYREASEGAASGPSPIPSGGRVSINVQRTSVGRPSAAAILRRPVKGQMAISFTKAAPASLSEGSSGSSGTLSGEVIGGTTISSWEGGAEALLE